MECPSCQAEMPEGKRFCMECGAPLPRHCPSCGSLNPPSAKFCGGCGAKLGPADAPASLPPTPAPLSPALPVSSAERRQLTVMFCDLVGSTALSARMDPEDLRELIASFHDCVTRAVARFNGFIARYMGDGVLVYFGFPEAHEDDPEQALRAALALIEALVQVRASERLQARIGIATGLVVAGDLIGSGRASEQAVVGETPNLAARLQALADPDTVVIADSTRRLVGKLFEFEDLGPQQLKGFAEPQRAWRVLGESSMGSRFEALRSGETPLVGREEEAELLLRRWAQARQGEGRVVLLSAEPGIGKSRLTGCLQERIQAEPHTRLRYFCSPHHQDSALFPIISRLERAARFEHGDTPQAKRRKLEALLASTAPSDEDVAIMAELLSLPGSGRDAAPELTPQRRKGKTFEVLLRQLEGLARQQPMLMIFEDVQWIDPTTRELLDLMIERAERLPVLLIATFRPEFQPPWGDLPHVTVLTLARLGRRQASQLVERLAGGAALPGDVVEEIVARTDGVPLFIEELTKAVLEAQAAGYDARGTLSAVPGPSLVVPATLQASLMARLDRLGSTAKEVAEIGAAIGREFPYDLLAAVRPQEEAVLQESLERLVQAGLIFRRGTPPNAIYLFKHALVQDAAYGTLLRGPRRQLHARIAQVLEESFPEAAAHQPELLAHHFAEAGDPDTSIDYYLKAAERATGRSALAEKVSHLRKGLRQIEMLADSAETRRRELVLQLALGRALIDHRGSGSEEVGTAFKRAISLCRELDDTEHLLSAYDGLFNYHFTHSEPDKLLHYAHELLDMGQQTRNRQAVLMARRSGAYAHFLLGHFPEARDEIGLLLNMYEAKRDSPGAAPTTRDPKVSACTLLGICLTAMGQPGSGSAASLEGIRHAEALDHTVSLILGLRRACVRCMMVKDTEGVIAFSNRLLAVNAEYETFLGSREGAIFHCWAQLQARGDAALLDRMRAILDELDAADHRCMLPFFMTAAAEVLGVWGRVDHAIRLLSRAAELTRITREQWCEAEVLRLEARFCTADADESATLLQTSHALAREQGAKLWELRTAIDLAKLRRRQGRRAAAHEVLAPVHGWFTEGFDTSDLREAKALLAELCE